MKNVRQFENLHIAMWLLKDTCWVTDFKTGGIIMIIPTLTVAFYITWKMRMHAAELFHNLAVCCWICANSIWMIGEFFYDDTLRTPAIIFFSFGLLFIAYYYMILLPKQQRTLRAERLRNEGQIKADKSTDSFLS